MINFFFLKTFVDACKTGSFRKAAHRNFISQPAVTQHVQLLEEKLGCKLFERRRKRIILTSSGQIFLGYAEDILKKFDEALSRVSEHNRRICCSLRIASIYSIGLYLLSPIIRSYAQRYPKINIHFEYHLFDQIYEMTANQAIDFGFVAYPEKKQGVCSELFAEEELVLVQSPHHRHFEKKRMPLAALDKAKFIAFASQTPTRIAIDSFLQGKGVHPNIVNEYDNIETLKNTLQLGLGCSIVPKNTVIQEIKNRSVEVIPIEGLTLKRPLGILFPKRGPLGTAAKAFYQLVTTGKITEHGPCT